MSILVILSSNTPGCNCMFKKVIKRTHLHPDASYGCIFQIYKRTTSRWSIWIRHPDGLAGSSRCTNEHGHNAIPHHFIYNIMDNKYIQLFKKKKNNYIQNYRVAVVKGRIFHQKILLQCKSVCSVEPVCKYLL